MVTRRAGGGQQSNQQFQRRYAEIGTWPINGNNRVAGYVLSELRWADRAASGMHTPNR